MLRTRIWLLLGTLAALVAPSPAPAVTLTLDGPDEPTLVGQILAVDVLIGPPGLGNFAAPSVRSFDLDVSYDPSHLAFVDVVFDVYLGTPDVQALTDFGAAGGVVDLAEVSLLSPASALHALQPDSFHLATLRFTTLSEATSALAFTQTLVSDTGGTAFAIDAATGTSVTSIVPEPGTAWLLALGLAGLAASRAPRQPPPGKRSHR
jgi:hypothetical protein